MSEPVTWWSLIGPVAIFCLICWQYDRRFKRCDKALEIQYEEIQSLKAQLGHERDKKLPSADSFPVNQESHEYYPD